MTPSKAGIVTIAGLPNAGKSTLLNSIVGLKLGIVSPKPQATRTRVTGIVTRNNTQIVLLDTPGLLQSEQLLHSAMRSAALAAIRDADVILYLLDAASDHLPPLHLAAGLPGPPKAPIVTALNKVDRLTLPERQALQALHPEAHLISATSGEGVASMLDHIAALLPDSPFLYPEDDVSVQPTRFFAEELIRESALEQLQQEVPYGIAAQIEEFRESSSPVYIRAVIFVERKSQKGIVVGASGARIRSIGTSARKKIETLLGGPVYLDLWVKVLPNWSSNPNLLKRLGYNTHKDE